MYPPFDLRRPSPPGRYDREFVETRRQAGTKAEKLAEIGPQAGKFRALDRRAQRTDHAPSRASYDLVVDAPLLRRHLSDGRQWNACGILENGCVHMTSAAARRFCSPASMPISARTAAVSAPSSGGARSKLSGASTKLMGLTTCGTSPDSG